MKGWCVGMILLCFSGSIGFGQDHAAQRKADSLSQQIDSLQWPAKKKVDSLQQLSNHAATIGTSAQHKVQDAVDSLNPNKKLANYQTRIDSAQNALKSRLTAVQSRLKSKSDSLRSQNLPTDKVDAQMAKLQSHIDSLKFPSPSVNLQQAEERLHKLNSAAVSKVEKWEQGVGIYVKKIPGDLPAKLAPVSSLTNSVAQQLPSGALPTIGSGFAPPTSLPGVGTPSLPGSSLPSMSGQSGINSPANPMNVPGLPSTAGFATSSGVPATGLPTSNLDALNDVSKSTNELSQLSAETNQYSEQMNQFNPGEIDSAVVKKWMEQNAEKLKETASNLPATQKLREQQQAIENYKQMTAHYRDPEAMRKELERNAKELAFDKVEAAQTSVNEAVADLNKVKMKYEDVKTIGTGQKPKRINPMRGKPLVERLLPGVNFQLQSGNNFLMDINPYVGYHLSGRWTAGLGWNERISFNFTKGKYFINEDHVYGVRSFFQYRLRAQLSLRGEVEVMNTPIRQPNLPLDNGNRKWVWSYLVGIKQEFRISKKINGSAQVLYNVYDPKRESPYADRLLIRFGLEFPQVKRKAGG